MVLLIGDEQRFAVEVGENGKHGDEFVDRTGEFREAVLDAVLEGAVAGSIENRSGGWVR